MDLDKRIKQLENKIKDFGSKYSDDALTSHNEATQAALTIEIYKKQLDELKKQKSNQTNSERIFELKSENNETIKIAVSGITIDPIKRIISSNSPVGKLLLKSKLNDSIKLGNLNYIVTKIS